LHTHDFQAPLSGRSEVSAFGDDGNGDTGDNWQLICEKQKEGEILKASYVFYLFHVDTKRYLVCDSKYEFNHRNCGSGCPILGQLEVSAEARKSDLARWRITSVFNLNLLHNH